MRKFLPTRAPRSYQIIVEGSEVSYKVFRNSSANVGTPSRPSQYFVFFLLIPKLSNLFFYTYSPLSLCCSRISLLMISF